MPYGLEGSLLGSEAENTLSTVDQGHLGMISIMKAFNSGSMSRRKWGAGGKNVSAEELRSGRLARARAGWAGSEGELRLIIGAHICKLLHCKI